MEKQGKASWSGSMAWKYGVVLTQTFNGDCDSFACLGLNILQLIVSLPLSPFSFCNPPVFFYWPRLSQPRLSIFLCLFVSQLAYRSFRFAAMCRLFYLLPAFQLPAKSIFILHSCLVRLAFVLLFPLLLFAEWISVWFDWNSNGVRHWEPVSDDGLDWKALERRWEFARLMPGHLVGVSRWFLSLGNKFPFSYRLPLSSN